MQKIKENVKIRKKAFLFQFEGDEEDARKKLLGDNYWYSIYPVEDMLNTGMFGILDALIDLGLTNNEIVDFYIHGHVEPYTDPCCFTNGIIEIVHGMPIEEVKSQYGRYFDDERIEKFVNINKNTQMLMSFCYDKDDTYLFVPDKNDLCNRFSEKFFGSRDDVWSFFKEEKEFQKIDGELFRAVHFLVRQGYDFPELESLFNNQIKDIVFKQTDGDKIFILNKKYAREIGDNVLSLVTFLKINDYELLNPEFMFEPKCEDITLIDSSDKKTTFSRSYLEPDVNKYNVILRKLNYQNFEVLNIISLCDRRIKDIKLKFTSSKGIEHSLVIKRDVLLSIHKNILEAIKLGYELGCTFPDNDNLFDMKQEFLKLTDPSGKKHLVVREQLMHVLTIISLLTSNGYSFKDYISLFDENQSFIVCFDDENHERLISRKQINKIIRLQELSNKTDLTNSEKDLLSMIETPWMRKKLFEWLPYTAKKWIPSSAVISKIPARKSHEYFYNNNYSRLGMLKDEYQVKNYDEMEGLVSLGYILGLFDSKESTSEKAKNYIIDYFLKKGITADELHTTYGSIDLKKGYDTKFADFFMQHYAINSESFIEPDLGTNMVGELFERFDEVLKSRPEKRIKTRTINKLLTPIDAMAAITNIQIDREMLGEKADDERYIHLAQLLLKFGASSNELKWAIGLYEQALALDELQVKIPHIEDLETSLMKFTSHLKNDPQAFLSGRKTNCCSKYGGHAQDRLTHVITDLNWRYVSFTSPNRTFFDGLVWYDRDEKVVCIDNVEGQFSKIDKNNASSIAMMADTIIRYADGIYCRMNELDIPCIKVNVGNDPRTASYEIFKYARQQELIHDDCNPCYYPQKNNITTDANKQFTITDQKILSLRKNVK